MKKNMGFTDNVRKKGFSQNLKHQGKLAFKISWTTISVLLPLALVKEVFSLMFIVKSVQSTLIHLK